MIYVGYIWCCQYMMRIRWWMMTTYYDDNIWWSYWWSHMMIIHDDHIWWSFMLIIFDAHIWWAYTMMIWESCGGHLEDIWESFGIHLGAIWEPFGSHLGSIWRHLGGWRLKRHLEVRSQITSLPLQRNAKVPLTFQFHKGVLRVPSIMTAYLQQHLLTTCVQDLRYSSRALYQDCENPIS